MASVDTGRELLDQVVESLHELSRTSEALHKGIADTQTLCTQALAHRLSELHAIEDQLAAAARDTTRSADDLRSLCLSASQQIGQMRTRAT